MFKKFSFLIFINEVAKNFLKFSIFLEFVFFPLSWYK